MAPPAPDGGFWGWMAVVACFMGNVIGDGVMYRYNVLYTEYIFLLYETGLVCLPTQLERTLQLYW
jgi:hypothetical protein